MIIRKRTRKQPARSVLYQTLIRSMKIRRRARHVEGGRHPRDVIERFSLVYPGVWRRLLADIELEQAAKEMAQMDEYFL